MIKVKVDCPNCGLTHIERPTVLFDPVFDIVDVSEEEMKKEVPRDLLKELEDSVEALKIGKLVCLGFEFKCKGCGEEFFIDAP